MIEIEAIKELQDNIDLPFGVSVSDEASRMAIKALEKQIAKKPISYDDCEQFVIRCTCGKCTDTRFFHGYCTWCGQKLDWSNEE